MNEHWSRRRVLKQLAASSAVLVLPGRTAAAAALLQGPAADREIQIASVSLHTVRLTVFPIRDSATVQVPYDGSLLQKFWGPPILKLRGNAPARELKAGSFTVHVSADPIAFTIATSNGTLIQQITVDKNTGSVSFTTGDSPLLGLGEGGPQFDRRGSIDPMIGGQGGYRLATHGGRVPIPWVIGTAGWAMFFHQPLGKFEFAGSQSKFQPSSSESPLDIFLVASSEPGTIMSEYARLTGHAEMPPLWSLGYQQSHRTLASGEEILTEAKTFRQKTLPCDALIYLGTGFCPSGWNTENGSFSWNSRVFPDPKKMIDELHKDNFHVVLHDVILTDTLRGTVHDPCALPTFDEALASCYWNAHRKDFAMGVDGWWPDEGDPLDIPSRLARNRMHWEGPQFDRPNERPYALHRNGYAGMQRFASFLWSGDVYSTWETLKTQVSVGINAALTGIPYWGTDIGGFVPTSEFTSELYLRWFQFGAFCTLFRAHGRAWKLRLPWGWNSGDPGPVEIRGYNGAAVPDASQLHNPQVEPICRKYLELRYRMLPYLYSAVHECATTGMPVMRALWLHYPNDPAAVARGDEYLWGRSVLVAPVVEKGATTRNLYLPRGDWYDFWTGERIAGGREINRPVDLETIPLFVAAGTILPLGPVKQHTNEKTDKPLSISIYPGADGSFLLYEDDGCSFNYRKGEWMGVRLDWNDARRTLRLAIAPGSRMLSPFHRTIEVSLLQSAKRVLFEGKPIQVAL
ncbi:Glycoside hydrolase, family 31 [Candidatus Sulfotelmatobacter kueseliae]|uniref:Glycoside hydrolase, family 31 n=1 Tax=Candidatus Sulfotelmatobacter kueseliae TaxID=2042962 RepID=A0A2U3JY73_9BACT|nr:Glycoside hydrolase, family 31 [Candidatus Sulfotelmatobacter kueseliae]